MSLWFVRLLFNLKKSHSHFFFLIQTVKTFKSKSNHLCTISCYVWTTLPAINFKVHTRILHHSNMNKNAFFKTYYYVVRTKQCQNAVRFFIGLRLLRFKRYNCTLLIRHYKNERNHHLKTTSDARFIQVKCKT